MSLKGKSAPSFIGFGSSNLDISFNHKENSSALVLMIFFLNNECVPHGHPGLFHGLGPMPKAKDGGRLNAKTLADHIWLVIRRKSSSGLFTVSYG